MDKWLSRYAHRNICFGLLFVFGHLFAFRFVCKERRTLSAKASHTEKASQLPLAIFQDKCLLILYCYLQRFNVNLKHPSI
ncbi:hypothetical protein F5X96DRAFT_658427 [Biscogniauxia mediterranea]|nr:hypothetical protein F5X96DRAFT_658427 [Biscogniauxia mediterranea]